MTELRATHLPYLLERIPDGRYAVLNRMYKPVGMDQYEWVAYEDYAVGLKRLTANTVVKMSFDGSPSLDRIYLYNDGCVPTRSATYMAAYMRRLAAFAKLLIVPPAAEVTC